MNNKSKTDRSLTKLKLALTTGGLIATVIGAGLLGREAGSLAAYDSTGAAAQPAITTNAPSVNDSQISGPADLDLQLEAIPTVAAPTISTARVAVGRSSG